MARIILLNGVSSAGKTSLARSVQRQAKQVYIRVSLDDFISMLPVGVESSSDWFPHETSVDGGYQMTKVRTGPRGAKLLDAMRLFIIEAAERKIDCIVDDVCTHSDISEMQSHLAEQEFIAVKVDAPLNVIERREADRGDRLIGLARAQAKHLHDGIDYDYEIDTSLGHPDLLATTLLRLLD